MGNHNSASRDKPKRSLFRRSAPSTSAPSAAAGIHRRRDQNLSNAESNASRAVKEHMLNLRADFERNLQRQHFEPNMHRVWTYMNAEEKARFTALWSQDYRFHADVEAREEWMKAFERLWTEFWTTGSAGGQITMAEYGYNQEEDTLEEHPPAIGLGIYLAPEPTPPPRARTMPSRS